jgi:phage virion morphogenesis protein
MTVRINTGTVPAALAQLERAGTDMGKLHRAIALELVAETEEAFRREGHPDKWKKLSAATIKRRSRKGQWPGKILQVTGALARAVTPSWTSSEARISVARPYAQIQQFGGKAGRKRRTVIPARPYLPLEKRGGFVHLNREAEAQILGVIREHFER